VLVLLVVATAATGIRLAGIAGALAAAVGLDFFLTEPYYALNIAGPDDIATAVLLLLVSGLVGEIALWGRRQVARASREQGYLDGVIGTAATAAAGRASTAQLTDQVARQITTSCRSTTPASTPPPTTAVPPSATTAPSPATGTPWTPPAAAYPRTRPPH
jgi:K+-sensing histidine kinase KdpD